MIGVRQRLAQLPDAGGELLQARMVPRTAQIRLCPRSCCCSFSPASASAARRWTFESKTSVRNHDGDFIIGYAFANGDAPNTPTTDHIDVQMTRGPWKYGYVDGPFAGWGGNKCGWVLGGSSRMRPTTGAENVPNRCPAPGPRDSNANPLAPQNIFAAGSYAYGTGGGTVWPAVIQPCANGSFAYANYNPADRTFSNKYGALPAGRGTAGGQGVTSGYSGFGWRYQTADGQAVLIKDTAKELGGNHPADTANGRSRTGSSCARSASGGCRPSRHPACGSRRPPGAAAACAPRAGWPTAPSSASRSRSRAASGHGARRSATSAASGRSTSSSPAAASASAER